MDHLMQFLRRPLNLFDANTVFSTVMVPATGYFKTVLRNGGGLTEASDKDSNIAEDSYYSRLKSSKVKLYWQASLSAPVQSLGMD